MDNSVDFVDKRHKPWLIYVNHLFSQETFHVKHRNRDIGNLGEKVACSFIEKHGYLVVDRNFWRKWGEIDIVAVKDNKLHFFEVKSNTHEYVGHCPEENVSGFKMHQLRKIIQTYLQTVNRVEDPFTVNVVAVYLNLEKRRAKVHFIKDIII